MSEVKKQKMKCPKCGNEIEIEVWDNIEMPYDVAMKERVMNNTLYKGRCSACNILFPIAYKSIYNDMEQKYLIWFAPRIGEKEQKEIDAYNEKIQTDDRLRLAQGGYRYRLVQSDNELREKILIFDEGLDDRYIETMKLVYIPILKNKYAKESKVTGMYFDKKVDGGYQMIVIFDNQAPKAAKVNMDIYHDMKKKLAKLVHEKTPEGVVKIDANWALDVMTQQVEGI